MAGGSFYFWLGASADADPATQATPEAPKGSSPSGECPLRNLIGYEIKPDYGYLSRLGGGNTQAFCDHQWKDVYIHEGHYPDGAECTKCGAWK